MSLPVLWEPPSNSQLEGSCIRKFQRLIRDRYHLEINNFDDLHRFSVEDLRFYELLWDYVGLRYSRRYTTVLSNPQALPSDCPKFYEGAVLNYAENCLHPIHPQNGTGCSPATPHDWPGKERVAIIEVPEGGGLPDSPAQLQAQNVTWGELRRRVAVLAAALRRTGVVKGDRIAHVAANTTRPIVSFLAAASIGAIFSALPTDAGVEAIYGRLSQIQPKLLFTDDAAIYNGKEVDVIARVSEAADRLVRQGKVGSDFQVISFHNSRVSKEYPWSDSAAKHTAMSEWLSSVDLGEGSSTPPLLFEQLDFSHPTLIVFSSGTTGEPKCITHSLGGMLVTQKKECLLHYDMKPSDIFLQITTTGWIMWLIALSAPLCGSTIIAYDGSPLSPTASHILKVLAAHKATGFGCSPRFLSEVERAGLRPREELDLSNLRLVTSTGSPLSARNAKFFYDSFAPSHTQLMSISGGTDIAGTFVCGAPTVPVRGHLIGCKTLGMDVRILDAVTGEDCEASGKPGELVCARPFLTQPLMFWGPPEKRAELDAKYLESYYSRFSEPGKGKGYWAQGDFISRSRDTGALEILGRSDGVLNPSGVRFGSAEIYAVVDRFEWALDSICVGQKRPGRDEDERVLLFIKPRNPSSPPSRSDIDELRAAIRAAYSARHVPAHVFLVQDIPLTANGKKTELAVKAIVCGDTRFKASSAIANPQALDEYRKFVEIERVAQSDTKAKL